MKGWYEMDKQKIASMFGIETYRDLAKEQQLQIDSLADQVAEYRIRCEELEKELYLYKLTDEAKVDVLRADIKSVEELYKKRITEYEQMTELAKSDCDLAEKMMVEAEGKVHRAFANGRAAAYSEMGIWRLDAIADGNVLVQDKEGNVYELLQGLEDVVPDVNNPQTTEDEIFIDDLEGVTE